MAPFLILLLIVFVDAGLNDFLYRHTIVRPHFRHLDPGTIHLSFNAFNREFVTQLKEIKPTVTSGVRIVDGHGREHQALNPNITRYYTGYIRGCSNCHSQVTIHDDNAHVYGVFHIDDDTLYLEPVIGIDDKTDLVAYWASDVKPEALKHVHNHGGLFVPRCPEKKIFDSFRRVKREATSKRVKRNRCEMKLVADYEFYKVVGNSNYYTVVRYLTNAIVRVNKLFEAVNWGKSSDGEDLVGLGFVLKELKIYDKPMPRPKQATDDWSHVHFNYEASGAANIQGIMTSFSTEEGTNETCVTVLATGKVGEHGILGLAVKGTVNPHNGACAKTPSNDIYLNTGVVTVWMKDTVMITRIFDLVLAHELGHIWGAAHDKDKSCHPDSNKIEPGGRYIMHETENTGYDANNYEFSDCSRNSIYRLMYHVQPWCFVEESTSVCGNGVLEPGEECDPGGYWLAADSEAQPKPDRCCSKSCKLVPKARCSPRHSDCCSSTCDYQPAEHLCLPQNNDSCKRASHCTGSSHFCPAPFSVEDGTRCTDEGTCQNGTCRSVCEMHDPKLRPCLCESMTNACLRCCKEGANGKCQPLNRSRKLPEGSICFLGECKKQVCVKKVADVVTRFWNIVADFQTSSGFKLIGHFIVFITIFLVTLAFIPWWVCVRNYDNAEKQEQELNVVRVPDTKKINRPNVVRPQV